METKLISEINATLLAFHDYWENNTLIKSKVIEDLRNYRVDLLEALLSNEIVKDAYSLKVDNGFVFKSDEFISMLRFKSYWDNSYTKFSNEIGLTSDGRYLKYNTDVVVDFPHKDCVLEGGMSTEDIDRNEIYYHNVLAKEEIDIMLSPKVLTNIKKYSKDGEESLEKFDANDNLILKGNNLIALHSLKERFMGKVKTCIIDPPYYFNEVKSEDSFGYNSNFKLSTWLTFMKNRLEIAKDLLVEGGSIWITIDDGGAHYLKVLMDTIFPNGFVANVLWQKRTSPDSRASLGGAHDHILVFTNNKEEFKKNLNKLPLSDSRKKDFNNPDNDERGEWVSVDMTGQMGHATSSQFYNITLPSGDIITPPEGRCWAVSQNRFEQLRADNRIWFGAKGDGRPRFKNYLSESEGGSVWTWWTNKEVGHNQEAKKESIALFGEGNSFSTPKPERLIHRIVSLCTDERDLVLDFFSGSGTTASVCHKMNRQFIAIEQITYGIDYSPERLKKVIEGEEGGITKEVDWHGGGSFVYAELQEQNMSFIALIQQVKNENDINLLLVELKESAFLNFKIDIEKVTTDNNDFMSLSLEEKKRILIETLDMNQLYLSYSEMDDSQFDIPESVKKFNHSFYKDEGVSNNE